MPKKILITGSTGMVGKNLITLLCNNKNYNLITPTRSELDLNNFNNIKNYFLYHKPDVIIHLAARVGGIQANINHPTEFLTENLSIGLNVITAAKECKITQFINISSSCVYPRNRELLAETDILTGELEPTNEGYALAKISAMRLCEYINKQYHYQYKTLIPPNLYGPYDNFSLTNGHLIPAMLRKLHEAKINNSDVVIWGDGHARREFLYVEDFVAFIVFSIEHLSELLSSVNIGLSHDYSINDYYQAAAKVVGFNGNFTHDLSKPVGMKKKLLDSRVAEKLGWRASTSLHGGLTKTYQYYLENKINGND